jgi:hypothetical protein
VRALLTNHGFTISVLAAIVVVACFAFVFGASQQLVAALLILGIFTAVVEYVLRSRSEPPP